MLAEGHIVPLSLCLLLESNHRHKGDVRFAVVPNALILSGALKIGRRQIYDAIEVLLKFRLLERCGDRASRRHPYQYRLTACRRGEEEREVCTYIGVLWGYTKSGTAGRGSCMKRLSVKLTTDGNEVAHGVVIDWCVPFARKVLSRLHEYDDAWPRSAKPGIVISMSTAADGSIVGDASDVRRSEERRAILDVLRTGLWPMTPSDVAAALGKSSGSVKKMMFVMANAGEIRRQSRGLYVLAIPGNLGNSGNPCENSHENQVDDEWQGGYRHDLPR